MMGARLLPLLLAAYASVAQAQTWRTLDVSRQLRDTTEHRIKVRYGAGTFSLRPTTDPVLFSMQLRYDEERSRPLHENVSTPTPFDTRARCICCNPASS